MQSDASNGVAISSAMLNRRNFCLLIIGAFLATPSFARRRKGRRRYNENDLPTRFHGSGLRRSVKYTGRAMCASTRKN